MIAALPRPITSVCLRRIVPVPRRVPQTCATSVVLLIYQNKTGSRSCRTKHLAAAGHACGIGRGAMTKIALTKAGRVIGHRELFDFDDTGGEARRILQMCFPDAGTITKTDDGW